MTSHQYHPILITLGPGRLGPFVARAERGFPSRVAPDMTAIAIELCLIFALLIANGVFSMAEIAIVSARKARLRQLAETGDSRAKAALELAESPNTFLATVQIGITLVGVLAAAFSGATMA